MYFLMKRRPGAHRRQESVARRQDVASPGRAARRCVDMMDVDTASERYLPAVVERLVTAIEARAVPADQRANLGERLEA